MAKMIAATRKGMEFLYNREKAYKVSEAAAEDICGVLNAIKWRGEYWHIYECGGYEMECTFAGFQKLTRRKGVIKASTY